MLKCFQCLRLCQVSSFSKNLCCPSYHCSFSINYKYYSFVFKKNEKEYRICTSDDKLIIDEFIHYNDDSYLDFYSFVMIFPIIIVPKIIDNIVRFDLVFHKIMNNIVFT